MKIQIGLVVYHIMLVKWPVCYIGIVWLCCHDIIVEVSIQHTSYTSTNIISLMQEIPQGLRRMADRFSVWKEKKDADRVEKEASEVEK
jgi:hypothetical protein